MSQTIFIRMLGNGGVIRSSYVDLYRMVEMWGYQQCLLGDVDFQSDNIYICTFKDGAATSTFSSAEAQARKCKVVLWQLEWPEWHDGELRFPEWTAGDKEYKTLGEWLWADEIWLSDLYALELIHRFHPQHAHRFRYVFLGGHPNFGAPPSIEQYDVEWDITHLMYAPGARGLKLTFLRERGYTIALPTFDETARDHQLRYSRWGLHLHQGTMPVIAPQRFMVFASYGLPILTDYCADPSPYKVFQDALVSFDPRATSVCNRELRMEAVKHNYELVTQKMTFRSQVDFAVQGMLRPEFHTKVRGIQDVLGAQKEMNRIEAEATARIMREPTPFQQNRDAL